MTQDTMDAGAKGALDDDEIAELQALLDALPPPLQPPDVCAIDGYLCGVLLQPIKIPEEDWLPWVFDIDGRSPPPQEAGRLVGLVQRRATQLEQAIRARQWFDPWVFELEDATSASDLVLPWVAGFAAAMDRYPGLMRVDDAQLLEPLALLYMHFDPDDLEDAQALQQLIETLEPPQDLGEAVQDIVRSLMLMADVVRPLPAVARPGQARRAQGPRRRR